jgi:hypothetical protein
VARSRIDRGMARPSALAVAACGPYPWRGCQVGCCTAESRSPPPPGLWQRWVISTGFQSSEPSLYVGNGSNTYRVLCIAAKIFECHKPI